MMAKGVQSRDELIEAIKAASDALGGGLSKRAFLTHTGMTEYQINSHFDSWNAAVEAAGLDPYTRNIRIEDSALLEDWGQVVRKLREIPTVPRFRREGRFCPEVFQRRFGAWSKMPIVFAFTLRTSRSGLTY
jgi:hypothetical protein